MTSLSRRSFTKRLLTTSGSLLAAEHLEQISLAANPCDQTTVPDSIAGYTLTPEDKALVSKFLARREKDLLPLRANDLQNATPPCFTPWLPSNNKSEDRNNGR
ncbi:MAG: hypothetical protein AAB393_00040 [Bacteroidota bacterium]